MQKQRAHIACNPQLAFFNRSHKIEYKCDDINSPSPLYLTDQDIDSY
jgi:hypothetical protein